MITLSTIVQDRLTKLFEKHQLFFAFDQKTFKEKRIPDVEYVNILSGGLLPKANALPFRNDYKALIESGIKEHLALVPKRKLIQDALSNHECYYTGEIDDAIKALADYGITDEEIREVYSSTYQEQEL
jgi:hypothetical protein